MIENLFVFFVIIAAGTFFKWKRPGNIDPDSTRHIINTIVINLMLPALCFRIISSMSIDINTILFPVSAILTILSATLFAYITYTIAAKFIDIKKKEKGALILMSAFSNASFFGLPILIGVYGEEAAKYPIMYDLLATGILLWTLGVSIASYYGNGKKATLKEGFKTLIKLPPIWAMILGFAVNFLGWGVKLPLIIIKVLDMLSMPVIPLMIFSMGFMLQVPKFKQIVIAVPAVIIKLCISPLLAFAIVSLLGMSGLPFKASVLEASLPVMTLALVVASQYKLDHTLAALIMIITIALSFITIPTTAWLVRGF
jgi:predicted permease